MIENLKPLYQKFEEAVKGEDYEEAQSNMCHLTAALAQEIVQAIPCNPLSAPVIAAAGKLAERLLKSQSQIWDKNSEVAAADIYKIVTKNITVVAIRRDEVDADD